MHIIQEKILKLIDRKSIQGMTLRKIGEEIGEQFPQKVKHHLSQLESKGLIKINKKDKSVSRNNAGLIKNGDLISIPIVGSANCGVATIFANENIEGYIKISKNILKSVKTYSLSKPKVFR